MKNELTKYLSKLGKSSQQKMAEAVALTRQEPGVSIEDIAKCFLAQFDEQELSSLINELNKKSNPPN